MNILICSYAYPPISSPGAMRVYHFAKGLADAGHNVTVLTTSNGYSSMISDVIPKEENIDVIRVRDVVPKNRLTEPAAQNLKKETAASGFKRFIKKIIVRIASALIYPDRDITWLLPAYLNKKVRSKKFDVVLGSYPYATNLVLAAMVAKLKSAKLVLDIRDLWTEEAELSGRKDIREAVDKKLEGWVFQQAHGLVSVSEVNADYLVKKLRKYDSQPKIVVVRNGFDFDKIAGIRERLGVRYKNEKYTVAYAGSFYGGERDPRDMFKALSSLKRSGTINASNFNFVIYGPIDPVVELWADELDVLDLVDFVGMLPQSTLFEKLFDADLLFVVTRKAAISAGEMTTKVYEYIGLGPDILCLCQRGYEIEKVMNEVVGAEVVHFGDLENIERVVSTMIKGWKEAVGPSYRRPLSLDFSREQGARELSCFLDTL